MSVLVHVWVCVCVCFNKLLHCTINRLLYYYLLMHFHVCLFVCVCVHVCMWVWYYKYIFRTSGFISVHESFNEPVHKQTSTDNKSDNIWPLQEWRLSGAVPSDHNWSIPVVSSISLGTQSPPVLLENHSYIMQTLAQPVRSCHKLHHRKHSPAALNSLYFFLLIHILQLAINMVTVQ